eukprot:CAMPEP_0202712488 /NCGR_PEP_ID=MMETSP1385-20130828/41454_1 /ASSEMBLY_ACC=CAM_ASM_000861 /TAXON_ID=933848 /ORGANISM="Elphidium margaritaceum" /LENGTH=149 /DNA_ID=CAMNT_0049372543 /DNA_START=104 /DNA_END=553 /DNA_ORIENTATION=+
MDDGRVQLTKFKRFLKGLVYKEEARYRRQYNIPDWYVLPAHARMTPAFEKKLNKYGLLYDDWAWPDKNTQGIDKTIKHAFDQLPLHIKEMRQRRVDRSSDLKWKHVEIPESMYNHQGRPFDPNLMYITPIISKMKMEQQINRDMVYKYE